MCNVCDFYQRATRASVSNPAINQDRTRTIWGDFVPEDAVSLATFYPLVGKELIIEIAHLIRAPRLLEVVGVTEMLERWLSGEHSHVTGVDVPIVINPFSILFWSEKHRRPMRVKTTETELMHGPMEKLSLCQRSLRDINRLLDTRFGVQLTFLCSCASIMVQTSDLDRLYDSYYYNEREELGRRYDTDRLTMTGDVLTNVSVADVPAELLAKTADFGPAEVASYLRLAQAARVTVALQSVTAEPSNMAERARKFLQQSQQETILT